MHPQVAPARSSAVTGPTFFRVVRCDVGDFAPGAASHFTIVARVNPGAARRLLRAALRVSGSRPDPAGADNRDVATTRAGRAPARPNFTG